MRNAKRKTRVGQGEEDQIEYVHLTGEFLLFQDPYLKIGISTPVNKIYC